MLHGDEATGTGASYTSTKPRGWTRATLPYSHNTRFPTSHFVVFQKRYESLIRFSILHRMISIPSRKRRLLHKARGTCRGPRRSSLRFIRTPTTRVRWKHKFTRRSWSAAPPKSFLG